MEAKGRILGSSPITSLPIKKEEKGRVCVTGAGGFYASWLIKLLLSKGYEVHSTVRDKEDKKNVHLKNLEHASENLKLFNADLLDYKSLYTAIDGCIGVFHVASPVPTEHTLSLLMCTSMEATHPNEEKFMEVELIEPAVTGTLNVLQACVEAKVKRVVVVSSDGAICMNPNWPIDQVMDETCWSDKEYCKATNNWYCFAKTDAESKAIQYGKENNLDVVTVCSATSIGPMLQSTVNASSLLLIQIISGGLDKLANVKHVFVDVRDVADALLLVYEKPEAEGRYICSSHSIRTKELVQKLRKMYPHYDYPKQIFEIDEEYDLNSEKLQKLGWNSRPLELSLINSVQNYQDAGVIDVVMPREQRVMNSVQSYHDAGVFNVRAQFDNSLFNGISKGLEGQVGEIEIMV